MNPLPLLYSLLACGGFALALSLYRERVDSARRAVRIARQSEPQ